MTSETYFSNQKIGKLVLHKVVRPIGAEIWPFQFPVTAILDLFCITATRGLPNLCAVVFENVISIPNTMQSFKKLSQSAQFLQILTYSLPANSKKT